MIKALCCFTLLLAPLFVAPPAVRGDDGKDGLRGGDEVIVRCDRGRTVTDALARHGGIVTIKIVGVCDEHVVVNRNDVSLVAGSAGAGIHGPDAAINTLMVTGDRFLLDGLTVTGGRNAVVVSGGGRATIRNCVVRASETTAGTDLVGGIGVIFFQGANGTVDNCESSGNRSDGLMLDAAVATITNSRFLGNGRAGIIVFHASTARIGLANTFAPAGNQIRDNGSAGIHVTLGSLGVIVDNTIAGNGTNPLGPFGRTGITVFQSRVDLPGRNLIENNFGQGVFIVGGSSAAIGDPGFGLDTRNTIRGNASAIPAANLPSGIQVFLNSTLGLRNAAVQNNYGDGVLLNGRSTLNVVNGVITGNGGNGIHLIDASTANFQALPPPIADLNGNGLLALECDADSRYSGPFLGTKHCTAFAPLMP